MAVGGDGFIIVDLPPEEAQETCDLVDQFNLCFIPLVSPTTTEERMALIGRVARGFVYCVSLTGVTGAREDLPSGLEDFILRGLNGQVRRNMSH